jgi:hypothetical protein
VVQRNHLLPWGLSILAWSACAHPAHEPASHENDLHAARHDTVPDALGRAIAHYQETGEIVLLERYFAAHPEADAGIWKEVVALRAYEQLVEEDGWNLVAAKELVHRYPDTHGAEMLAVRMEKAAFAAVASSPSLETLVAFLDGAQLEESSLGLDDERFRERYEERLRALLERRLVSSGCSDLMPYCTWWVDRHPEAASTQQLEQQMAEVWHRRAYPGWKGARHHRCAYRCGTTCRAQARPLDDSCYAPCYARCS